MAYTDGLVVLVPLDGSGDPEIMQVETTAADISDFVMPANVTILQFGVLVTETFSAHSTDPVVKLQKKSAIGATGVDLVSLTLGSSATLKKGDGVKEAQTAIALDADITNGDVVLANFSNVPKTVQSGEVLTVRHATAANAATGAYIPFVIVRVDGLTDARQTNVWLDVA